MTTTETAAAPASDHVPAESNSRAPTPAPAELQSTPSPVELHGKSRVLELEGASRAAELTAEPQRKRPSSAVNAELPATPVAIEMPAPLPDGILPPPLARMAASNPYPDDIEESGDRSTKSALNAAPSPSADTPTVTGDRRGAGHGYAGIFDAKLRAPFWRDGREPKHSFFDTPWVLYLLFGLGVAAAVAHHFINFCLHGKVVSQQIFVTRAGTLLSLFAKACFANVALLAFFQWAWVSVSRKFYQVEMVDSLFSATQNIRSLTSFRLWRSAKLAMLMALLYWISFLIVPFAADSLVVLMKTVEKFENCPEITTINMSQAKSTKWYEDAQHGNKFNFLWWHNSSYEPDGSVFEWYHLRTRECNTIVQSALLSGRVVPRPNISQKICGKGWDCDYTLNFDAPGYKCTTLALGVNATVPQFRNQNSPVNYSALLPQGDYAYVTEMYKGDYSQPQLKDLQSPFDKDGSLPPEIKDPVTGKWPRLLGAFRHEPLLWIGYSIPPPGNKIYADDAAWFEGFQPGLMVCEHYITNYNVTFIYTGGEMTHRVNSRNYVRRLIETDLVNKATNEKYIVDNTTAEPQANYVYPENQQEYSLVSAYHAVGDAFRSYMSGRVKRLQSGKQLDRPWDAMFHLSRVFNSKNQVVLPNFAEQFPLMFEEIVFSILANPWFNIVNWAKRPDVTYSDKVNAGVWTAAQQDIDSDSMLYPCRRFRTQLVYHYHWLPLWLAYGIAILMAGLALAVAHIGVHQIHGCALKSNKFSTIAAATHSSAVDEVRPTTRIGYGVLNKYGNNNYGLYSTPMLPDDCAIMRGFGIEKTVEQKPLETRGSESSGSTLWNNGGMRKRQ